ncbi:decarboxylase family protein [Geomicrobium sp. JCM 19055]|nr:decarboxylase family protein [Geomicrobium sp. JCM 19055]
MIQSLAVFCGSSNGKTDVYAEAARNFGNVLASQHKTLIYGGAQVGCMGAIADEVKACGGKAIGVIPEKLTSVEIAHRGLDELHVVETMHERKAKMAALSDGFVALPGGAGTLEEWFEVFTWAQIGYHEKPFGLLNVNHFYDPLLEMIDHTVEQEFMRQEYKEMILVSSDAEELLYKMDQYKGGYVSKW